MLLVNIMIDFYQFCKNKTNKQICLDGSYKINNSL